MSIHQRAAYPGAAQSQGGPRFLREVSGSHPVRHRLQRALRRTPDDADGIKKWQDKTARFYSRHLEYFETDQINLVEPYGYAKDWLRLAGANLPPEVLEKLYHANAERLIPALRPKQAERKPKG